MSSTIAISNATETFKATGLTEDSARLLAGLAWDAPNWSGTPMLCITKEQRGNLCDLKKADLVTTFKSDGVLFAEFTKKGMALIRTSNLADCIPSWL
jgi:hypothetical protein